MDSSNIICTHRWFANGFHHDSKKISQILKTTEDLLNHDFSYQPTEKDIIIFKTKYYDICGQLYNLIVYFSHQNRKLHKESKALPSTSCRFQLIEDQHSQILPLKECLLLVAANFILLLTPKSCSGITNSKH